MADAVKSQWRKHEDLGVVWVVRDGLVFGIICVYGYFVCRFEWEVVGGMVLWSGSGGVMVGVVC